MGEGDPRPPPRPLPIPQKHWQAPQPRAGPCGHVDPAFLCSEDGKRTYATSKNGFHRCGVYSPERRAGQPRPCLPLALRPGDSGTGPFSSLFADTVVPLENICLGGVLQGLILAPPEESIFSTQFPKNLVSWPFCVAGGRLQGCPRSWWGVGGQSSSSQGCRSMAPLTDCSHDTYARSLQQTAWAQQITAFVLYKSRCLASSKSPKLPIQTMPRKKIIL